MSIRAAIVGPTGYTGLYLIDILLRHPSAKLTYLASHREELPNIVEEFPKLLGRVPETVAACRPIDPQAIAAEADVVFLALPHRTAMTYAPRLLEVGLHVIDLSADYRLSDAALYKTTYGQPHTDTQHLEQAVYGIPELFRDQIPGAKLVANPGCYPTSAALALAPLLKSELVSDHLIIVNATSGVTGAGRSSAAHLQFAQQNEAFGPYGQIGQHRHQPEIEQTLSRVAERTISIVFTPHLLPVDRGILETIYLEPASVDVTEEDLFDAFEAAYDDEPFVRVRNDLPNIKYVVGTNCCDVTVRLVGSEHNRKIVVFSAIDNMVKGASGQAVQNMNLVFGQDETAGLM